jgi:hypothetical protein
MLDAIADGSSTEGLCAQLLRLAREGA